VIDEVTLATVKLAPVAAPPLWLLSPEYVAVTGNVPGKSVAGVEQLVIGSVTEQRVVLPEVNVMLPVAFPGSPETDNVTAVPYPTVAGAADSVNAVGASVTVNDAPVATAPLLFTSPEYVAVTGYVPVTSVADVAQLATGSVATHNGAPADVNVIVPVAFTGRPDTERVSCAPKAMLDGDADSVIEVLAGVTVKFAPVAVDPT
jgi:hypothetical protein